MVKIRTCFVSNSSSSSYICDVCGEIVSGWDMDLEEAEMYHCENDHYYCEYHVNGKIEITFEEMIKVYKECKDCLTKDHIEEIEIAIHDNDRERLEELLEDELYEIKRYEVSAMFCPICNFTKLTDEDKSAYLLKRSGLTEKQLLEEIRGKYNDYRKFSEDISI